MQHTIAERERERERGKGGEGGGETEAKRERGREGWRRDKEEGDRESIQSKFLLATKKGEAVAMTTTH